MKIGAMTVVVRRSLVVLAVMASLIVGVVSIRAAAAWTAAAAPLTSAPVNASSITDQLTQEQALSASLQSQLTGLMTRSSQLTTALQGAQVRIAADARNA
ncbi:MAG: hypothetical protein ACHQZR_09570, partial [Candidatus Limnocylindrales bacterium]